MSATAMTGAGIVVRELIGHGANIVFGYPGGYVIDIYDELYKNGRSIKHILTAHEQGAAHAADAYARVTGRPSAVMATGGPGATNLVTGIANAYLDSVPVVFLTGNVPVPMLGQDSFQDIDVVGVTLPIVKHSYVVRDVRELQTTLRESFMIAGSGRKGPVLVDIPKCVQRDNAPYIDDLPVSTPHGDCMAADPERLEEALFAIKKSERPYIYCGGGVTASESGRSAAELSEKLGAPIGTSLMGIGSVPSSYCLNLGMSGMHGAPASVKAMSEADLIIALGARFADRSTGGARTLAENATILHIDIDAAEIGKNIKANIGLRGNVADILPELLRGTAASPRESWRDRALSLKSEHMKPYDEDFSPRNIIDRVNRAFDDETAVATDVGQHQMWVAQNYRFEKPRRLITSGGLGAMGFGMGAAIGASLARGGRETTLFTSDGSFGMNLAELATAVTYKLPITVIILNNGALGMVRQMQEQSYGGRYSETILDRKTDFPALAEAFGAEGHRVSTLSELDGVLKAPLSGAPRVIECRISMAEKA